MPEKVSGVVKKIKGGKAVLRNPAKSFRSLPTDVNIPVKLVKDCSLVDGASVTGFLDENAKGKVLGEIESICGLGIKEFAARKPYSDLIAIDPCESFPLAASGETSMRVMDLVAPVGKGTRGLIVSPPKAGKTTILTQIARAIRAGDPQARIIVLLIDERPEEVTDFRRSVDAEVLASSSDQSMEAHTELAELTMAHIRTELECGHDVILLLDSITRLSRAFNLRGDGRKGKTMSGGMEAGSMEIPRRLFGLARNIEDGGSVTIIASALVDTGSRMDQLIFEEFKGTGNSEVVLERSFAEAMIYPAINVHASGTRKEERLYGEEKMKRIVKLRRALSEREPKQALQQLLKSLERYKTNEEFLATIPV